MLAMGFDCGECPVVSPSSRTASSSNCSGTPHCTVACMLYGSILTMRFISPPSTTIKFSTGVSSPPSVAVPPVRATTFTPCASANASTFATSSVLRTIATAAGAGMVYTPKMFCSLRKLSMLRSRSNCASVSTCSSPRICCNCSTMASRVRDMVAFLFEASLAQWKMG